ncbi:ExeM/NucH family extracellular endonuclease [bacterium]|nr:ExeM/NucH family extracellular endonuclease [bacterium]
MLKLLPHSLPAIVPAPLTSKQLLYAILLLVLLLSTFFSADTASVQAASSDIVISEFRVRGPNGGSDEFIELHNLSSEPVDISGWLVRGSNGTGGVSTRATIPAGTVLNPGCYYLLTNSASSGGPYSGSVSGDQTYATGVTDDGGIALTLPDTTIIDQVGISAGAAFGEGTRLSSLGSSNQNRSYERKPGGSLGNGIDTDDNISDFQLISPSNPQNSTSACILNVGDAAPEVADTTPDTNAVNVPPSSDITVTFSEPVNVIGDWATVTCGVSGSQSVAISGGPTDFVLNPNVDLPAGELCTVTISAANVTDVDTNDPPDNMIADFSFSFTVLAGNVCEAAFTPAYVIQGSGAASPLSGQAVTTQGVVVGDYEGPSTGPLATLRGFYLQDMTGDGDVATSDAIFVFNSDRDEVSLGDVVRVTGSVGEFQNQTQISTFGGANIVKCGTAGIDPVDVTFPVPSTDYLERYEGMLVRLPQTLYVTEFFQLGRFGQVVLSSGDRLRQPTNVVAPGAPALTLQAENNLNRIILDDALQSQNSDPIIFARGGQPLSAANTLRGGDTATGIVGVLTFTWAGNSASGNAYRVRPVNALGGTFNFEPANPRPDSVSAVGGTLKVASFNVLNYFVTIDTGSAICGPGQNADCRGADSSEELTRQRTKLLQALLKLDADVVGLIELENTKEVEPLADIVAGLNALVGDGVYGFINTGTIGTDAIKAGLIYKTTTVTPVGAYQILDSTDDPRFLDQFNRPVLAQTFRQNSNGEKFTIAVNHLKSKGSGCEAVGDPDLNDGQGNCNGTRTAAAQALVDWLAGDPTDSGDSDFLIVGDLNAYAKEDPVTAIVNAGYTDLVERFGGADAYGYVFDGQWGYLDHALASPTLDLQVTGVAKYHINADEPNVLDYNTNFKSAGQIESLYAPDEFRTSDHDPVVVGLNLDSNATLTIVLDAQPDSRLNFQFTGNLGDFILDDGNDDDAYSNSKVFENLPTGEPQSVVLNVPSLWYLTDISCDSPNVRVSLNRFSATVTPTLGEDITCTFTTKLTAVVWGYVYNDRNANGRLDWRDKALRDWTVNLFDESGEQVGQEITNRSGQVLFFPVKPGSVTLCQTTQPGWTNTQPGVVNPTYGQPCYSGNLPPGSIALALFGNTQERTGRALEAGDAVLSLSGVITADADEAFTLTQEDIAAELPEPLTTDEIFLPLIDR